MEFEQLRQWVVEGRANKDTLIQAEGDPLWKPLGQFAEFADLLQPQAARSFPGPGVIAPGIVPVELSPDEILARHHDTWFFECFGQGWNLLMKSPGLLICSCLLIGLISFGMGMIPILGPFLGLIFNGPLYGGIYYLFIRQNRDLSPSFSDAFVGFGPSFLNLMLGMIVVGLLAFLSGILGIMGVLGCVFAATKEAWWLLAMLVPLTLIGFVPTIYLSICWNFTLPLIIDKKMDFWPAMELSRRKVSQHWFRMFIFFLLTSILGACGSLFCLVGMILTLPWAIAIIVSAYELLFGAPKELSDAGHLK